ncbi:hypothetical protein niasHS_012751 [Heterodera schachtii]|uniref:Uncharacterized protein n=1 Tax=Heterodera schachtii TaxID=97005 RepID=A0ABD2HYB5_HETSC
MELLILTVINEHFAIEAVRLLAGAVSRFARHCRSVENGSLTGYTLKSAAPPRQWAENVSPVAVGVPPRTRALSLTAKTVALAWAMWPPSLAQSARRRLEAQRRLHSAKKLFASVRFKLWLRDIKPSGLFWHRRVLVETKKEGIGGNYHAFLYAIVRENRSEPQQGGGGGSGGGVVVVMAAAMIKGVIMMAPSRIMLMLMTVMIWLPLRSVNCWAIPR